MRASLLFFAFARASMFAAAVAIAGCGDSEPQGSLTWDTCEGGAFECASIDVPFDYDHPDQGSFTLPIVRRPADHPSARIGALFVNPGGPGGSAVELAFATPKFFPSELLEKFDVVGFEPRGAGSSTPTIACVDDLDSYVAIDLVPSTTAKKDAILSANSDFAKSCEARSGDLLPYVSTVEVARDMDRVREALGEETISYLGYSNGSLLGQLYADEFPARMRAFVLDGIVDPANDGAAEIVGQALGFEGELDAFFDDAKSDASNPFHSDGDPAAAYDALMAKIEAAPLSVKLDGEPTRKLGPGETWYAVTEALYSKTSWPALAKALADATKGDGSGLLELSDAAVGRARDGSYDGFYEQYLAISSIDDVWPTTIEEYDALADQVRPTAPRVGVALVYNSLLPMFWPVKPARQPAPIAAKGAPTILVVGNERDPATPYADAKAVAKELDKAVLLTWDGDGHTAFGGNSACIDDAVTKFFVDLAPPPDGTICH